jgi:hypothetical protein
MYSATAFSWQFFAEYTMKDHKAYTTVKLVVRCQQDVATPRRGGANSSENQKLYHARV